MINKGVIVREWLGGIISSDELKVYLDEAVVTSKPIVIELPK